VPFEQHRGDHLTAMQVSILGAFRLWRSKPPWFAVACVILPVSAFFDVDLCTYADGHGMYVSNAFPPDLPDDLRLQCNATTKSFEDMGKHVRLGFERAIEVLVIWLDCYISLLRRPEMGKYNTPIHSSATASQHHHQ
jgi:hypothetical protein